MDLEDDYKKLLEKYDLLKKEFADYVYITSHDFNEAINNMKSFSSFLNEDYGEQLNDEAQEFLSYIHNGSTRLHEMVQGLTIYSRVTTQGGKFEKSDLKFLVECALGKVDPLVKEKQAEIEVEGLFEWNIDVMQMISVFQELLTNALKFSITSPRIRIYADTSDEKLPKVILEDNGNGIKPSQLPKASKVLKKLHDNPEIEGIGMGLAVAKKVMMRHGGTLELESEMGKGTRVILIFGTGEE